ncbi:MAG TPA: hypothetical protein VGP97_22130 [Burkholderiales bacterium]|jgi:tripartite-type tricarboxylate transporter receptor subunit TctC|nr:hypothetical protein [Burkholderiales bacterium]
MGILRFLVGLSIAEAGTHAVAQGNYPEQPVRILVGFTAGVAVIQGSRPCRGSA